MSKRVVGIANVEVERESLNSSGQIACASIGKGGFGNVYRSKRLDSNKKYATKVIESDNHGVPCLMEISMMATYSHECLVHAEGIYVQSKIAYLLQDLAFEDIAKWRSRQQKDVLDHDNVREIIHSVTAGLEYLHMNNIIHGDIKAGNVLVFPGSDSSRPVYKLGDYTLSINADWAKTRPYKAVQTISHRPPEVWYSRPYDYSSDIWALGCMMFELIYGRMLFPYQLHLFDHKRKNHVSAPAGYTQRDCIRISSLNALCDWRDYLKEHTDRIGDNITLEGFYTRSLTHNKMKYIKPKIPEFDLETTMVGLMLDMLSLEPEKRPSTQKIFRHRFFAEFGAETTPNSDCIRIQSVYLSKTQLQKELKATVWNDVIELVEHTDICQHALNLFVRYRSSITIPPEKENLAIATCIFMAHKIVTRHNIENRKTLMKKYGVETYQVLLEERNICNVLGFQLHHMRNTRKNPPS